MAKINVKWLGPIVRVIDYVLHTIFRVPCPHDKCDCQKDQSVSK